MVHTENIFEEIVGFDWDSGNFHKNWIKHQVQSKGAEEIFTDSNLLIQEDTQHSQREKRWIAIGKSADQTVLFVVFTIRTPLIRVISARRADKKERQAYEKITQENTKI